MSGARDVGDPEPVGPGGAEVALDEIGERRGVLGADRRAHEPAAMDAREMVTPHQPRDPLARDVEAGIGEVGVDAGHAVRPAAPGMGAADLRGQFRIRRVLGRRERVSARRSSRSGRHRGPAEDPHRIARLLLLDEAEPGHRVRSVS